MWTIFIIAVVILIFVIISRSFINSNIKDEVLKKGGMLSIYKTLVDGLLIDNSQIFNISSDSISLGINNMDGSTIFNIYHNIDNVLVEWKVKSNSFGNHSLRWEFPKRLDQNEMLATIHSHVAKYTRETILKQNIVENETSIQASSNNAKTENLKIIAKSFNCSETEAQAHYFIKMNDLNPSEKDLEQLLNHLLISTVSEAAKDGISPKDTQSGMFYKWTKEYSKKNNINISARDIDTISDIYDSDPSFFIRLLEL